MGHVIEWAIIEVNEDLKKKKQMTESHDPTWRASFGN